MPTAVDHFDDKARATFDQFGQNEVYEGELQRHRVYTRFLHWMVALFFVATRYRLPLLVALAPLAVPGISESYSSSGKGGRFRRSSRCREWRVRR